MKSYLREHSCFCVLPFVKYITVLIKVQRADLTCHLIRFSSVCVENIWIFTRFLKLLSKSLRAAEKNKEKVEANCTGFSADFFGTQSVEMPGKQKFKCWQLLAGACFLSGYLFLNNYDFTLYSDASPSDEFILTIYKFAPEVSLGAAPEIDLLAVFFHELTSSSFAASSSTSVPLKNLFSDVVLGK